MCFSSQTKAEIEMKFIALVSRHAEPAVSWMMMMMMMMLMMISPSVPEWRTLQLQLHC